MGKIAEEIDNSQFIRKNEFVRNLEGFTNEIPKAIALSVADTVKHIPAVKGVIALTATGYTPALMSECRPTVPIYSLSSDLKVCRWLQLYNNVFSMKIEKSLGHELNIDAQAFLLMDEFLKNGLSLNTKDIVILTGSVPHFMSGESTNFLKIHEIS